MPTTTPDEWLERYARHLVDRAGVSPEQARELARAEDFAVLSEWYPDDPEEAAEMEMSYWTD